MAETYSLYHKILLQCGFIIHFFLIQICTRTKPDWLFLIVCNVLYIDILFSYNNWLWLGKDLMYIYDLWNTYSDNPSLAKSSGQRQLYTTVVLNECWSSALQCAIASQSKAEANLNHLLQRVYQTCRLCNIWL